METFDLWLGKKGNTSKQITAPNLFEKVTTKIGHIFKSLHAELRQTTSEKDELQEKIEQQEKCTLINWENLLGRSKIEDPVNMISATMENLATPPVSTFQFHQAYKTLILKWSTLPDLKNQSILSTEQFRTLWARANPANQQKWVT